MLGLTAAVVAGLGGAAYFAQTRQPDRQRLDQEAARALTGDSDAIEAIHRRQATGVSLMEDFLQRHCRANAAQIQQDIACLTNPMGPAGVLALARLQLLPERTADLLKDASDRLAPGETRETLRRLISDQTRHHKRIAGFLEGLYARNFHRLFVARRALLERDSQSAPARLFFAYAPFAETWSMLRTAPPDLQMRFLLLRLHTGRDGPAVDCLERFSAADVLRVARQTWWPVEIESSTNVIGAGPVTLAGALTGPTAFHILRLTPQAAASSNAAPGWASLERWFRWTFVFRYKEPWLGRQGVAYAENEMRAVNQANRPGPSMTREPAEASLWLPETAAAEVFGPGHCEAVRALPAGVRVPVAALSRQEAALWHAGGVFEWARPLFASAMQRHLRFAPNPHPPPQVFASAEEAAQQPRRSKRRR